MKRILCFTICVALSICASYAQKSSDSLTARKTDTPHLQQNRKIPVKGNPGDTLPSRANAATVNAQKRRNIILPDSNRVGAVTSAAPGFSPQQNKPDTIQNQSDSLSDSNKIAATFAAKVDSMLLTKNRFVNSKSKGVVLPEYPHKASGKEFLFYILCLVLLILGLFKTFFRGYFKNLFRVYFNTSLRQTQLSDQLQQATLPSLILNIFFAITAGIYIWLLFNYYHPPRLLNGRALLPFSILLVAVLYFLKFCVLKFMGWVTDVQESTNSYIFAIFLVNKIIGIFLVPVIILVAFVNRQWLPAIIDISIMMIALLFLSRYVKSYGAIEKKIPLNPFHFAIYIVGAEIVPLFILYKVAIDYLI